MSETLSPRKFLDQVEKINEEARRATEDLLDQQGDKKYVAIEDWADECDGNNGNGTDLSIFGIGLDEDDELCIAATVDNIGYGHSEDDFPQQWVKVTELCDPNFCDFYRFVANNIEKAVTKEKAERMAKKYWDGDESDDEKYDCQEGFELYQEGKEEEALAKFIESAEMGYYDAMRVLGEIYMGDVLDCVKADYEKAIMWTKKDMETGDRIGYFNLGTMYLEGNGVERDLSKAFELLKTATTPHRMNLNLFEDGSVAQAKYMVGMMYYVGAGTEKDFNLAFKYMKKAYEARQGAAILMLARIYERGEGVKANAKKAQEYKDIAAQNGFTWEESPMIEGYEFDVK